MAKGTIYLFRPILSEDVHDCDFTKWIYEKKDVLPPHIPRPIKTNRYVSFGHLGMFYVDLRYVDVTKFQKYEIPRKLIKKLSREVKLDYLLD